MLQEQKSVAEDPGRALNLGIGLASPLWPTFLATAGAGVAYWWWTQWTRVQDRSFAPLAVAKPFLKLVETPAPLAAAEPAPVAPVFEAAAELTEAVSETVQEATATAEVVAEEASEAVVAQATEVVEVEEAAVEDAVEAAQAAGPTLEEPVAAVAETVAPLAPRKRPVAAKTGAARASAPKPPTRAGKRTRTPE